MLVTYTFAGLPVSSYEVAYQWYVRLLGRAADMFPHETEAVWHLTPTSAIYVVEDSERAGRGLITVAVADVDELERRLADLGLAFDVMTDDRAPRRLVVTDPDGNRLTFFKDPAQTRG